MRQIKLLALSVAAILSLANAQAQTNVNPHIKTLPEFANGKQANAVWQLSPNIEQQLLNHCQGNKICGANYIEKLGANPQAVAFIKLTGGLVKEYQQFGNIYYIRAWLPGERLRAGVYIGNNNGEIIQVDNWLDNAGQEALSNKVDYTKSLQQYPETRTLYGIQAPPVYKKINNKQQIIFNYSLVDKCHGIDGYTKIAFEFNKAGQFTAAHFLTIESHSPGYKLPITTSCDKLERLSKNK